MKTLADFKRALTLGSEWEAYYGPNLQPLGKRSVGRVMSNGVGFNTERGTLSYFYYPKASLLRFLNEDTVEVYEFSEEGLYLILTYRRVA